VNEKLIFFVTITSRTQTSLMKENRVYFLLVKMYRYNNNFFITKQKKKRKPYASYKNTREHLEIVRFQKRYCFEINKVIVLAYV